MWSFHLPERTATRRDWRRDYLRAFVFRTAMRVPPKRMTRDIRIVHRKLIEAGRAVWLGDPLPGERPPPLESVERAVARVAGLFGVTVGEAGGGGRADGDPQRPQKRRPAGLSRGSPLASSRIRA